MRGSREVNAGWPAGANSVWQVEHSVHNEVENYKRPCCQFSASQPEPKKLRQPAEKTRRLLISPTDLSVTSV